MHSLPCIFCATVTGKWLANRHRAARHLITTARNEAAELTAAGVECPELTEVMTAAALLRDRLGALAPPGCAFVERKG